MKKRYAAGLALALVGILSVCGQTAADNTMQPYTVELSEEQEELIRQTGTSTTASTFIEYEFSGNHRSEAKGVLIWLLYMGWQHSGRRRKIGRMPRLGCIVSDGHWAVGKGTIKLRA